MRDENRQSPPADPGQTLSRSIEKARRLSIEAIVSDLELALTFLDTAHASRNKATIARCHRNAFKAFQKASQCAERLRRAATAEQLGRMEQLRESIRVQLAAFYEWKADGPPELEEFEE